MVHKSQTHRDNVSSLNGLIGNLTLTSAGNTITISTPTTSTINLETAGGGGGTPGGTDGATQINKAGVFYGDTSFLKSDYVKKFQGVQQTTPEAPLHATGTFGQTVDAPASLTAMAVLETTVPSPLSGSATQINGPTIPATPAINFTYIDNVTDNGVVSYTSTGQVTGSGAFVCYGQTISWSIFSYRLSGTTRVVNPNPLVATFTDMINDGSTQFYVNVGDSMNTWGTANGFVDGYIFYRYDPNQGAAYYRDIGNVQYYTDDGSWTSQDAYVASAYYSGGSTWNGYLAEYSFIGGNNYRSDYANGNNSDAAFGCYLIVNATFFGSAYSGQMYLSNNGYYFDVTTATSFDDYGQSVGSSGDYPAFNSYAFPNMPTTGLTASSSGSANQIDGSGSYTANGSAYSWTIYEYITHPITGERFYDPSNTYNFGTNDNNDGQPFYWDISFTPGSGTGRIWINQSGQGNDIGAASNFADDGNQPTAVLPSSIYSYLGLPRSYQNYGEITSPSDKYSTTHFDYSFMDDNSGYYMIEQTTGSLGTATTCKLIESITGISDRHVTSVTAAGTAVERAVDYDFNTTVTPNSVGFLGPQTFTYSQYATKTINGTVVYSLPVSATPVTLPNDGNYYTIDLVGSTVSGATYKYKRVIGGSTVYLSTGATSFNDNTSVSWPASSTVTPNYGPITALIAERNMSSSFTETPIASFRNTNGGQSFGFNAFYYTSGGGVYNEAARYGVKNNGYFGIDSFNHGLEIGPLSSPHTGFYPAQNNNPGAWFNVQSNSLYVLKFQGSSVGNVMWLDAGPSTAFFGTNYNNYYGGDPASAVAIQPVGNDLGVAMASPAGRNGSGNFSRLINASTGQAVWGFTNEGRGFFAANGNGSANLRIGAGSNIYTQIQFDNTTSLPSTPIAGGVEYSTNLIGAGAYYGSLSSSVRKRFQQDLGSATSGQFWFSDANGYAQANSTLSLSGSILQTNSTTSFIMQGGGSVAASKDFTVGSGGTLTLTQASIVGNPRWQYNGINSNLTLNQSHYSINCIANTFNITLPTAVSISGRQYTIKNTGTGVITLLTTSAQTIDGYASGAIKLRQNDVIEVESDGANWFIVTPIGNSQGITTEYNIVCYNGDVVTYNDNVVYYN